MSQEAAIKNRRDFQSHETKLFVFSIASRFLAALLLLLTSYLPLFDTSPRIILPLRNSLFSRWSSTLLRWDAFHFLHVAKEGHVFEHEWAFFPGTPYTMNLFKLTWITMFLGKLQTQHHIANFLVSGALAAFLCDGTLTLYRLTNRMLKSPSLAFLSALLSLLPLSPAALHHAAYSEPFFVYFSYKGMLYCADERWFSASVAFALAGSFRSNGILLSGFLVWGMLIDPLLRREKLPPLVILQCLALSTAVFMPFVHHQYAAYKAFCAATGAPAWCTRLLPSIYTHVQSKYWNVGFLRYWTVQQLPNFVISAPVLALLLYTSTHHIRYGFLPRARTLVANQRQYKHQDISTTLIPSLPTSPPSSSPFLSPQLTPHALHALFLSSTLLFAAHTQIILRLAASMPFTYWAAVQLWVEHPRWARWWTGWSVVWGAVSLVLWGTFLPPA